MTRSKKLYLEEWERVDDGQSHVPGEGKPHRVSRTTESEEFLMVKEDEWNIICETLRDVPSLPKSSWRAFGESNAPLWKHIETQESAVFWEPLGAPLLPKTRVRNFIHPKQLGIFSQTTILAVP